MSDNVLVTFAARACSTAGVAEAISEILRERGAQVEVAPMQDVTDLEGDHRDWSVIRAWTEDLFPEMF